MNAIKHFYGTVAEHMSLRPLRNALAAGLMAVVMSGCVGVEEYHDEGSPGSSIDGPYCVLCGYNHYPGHHYGWYDGGYYHGHHQGYRRQRYTRPGHSKKHYVPGPTVGPSVQPGALHPNHPGYITPIKK